jgi:hypothetical protein
METQKNQLPYQTEELLGFNPHSGGIVFPYGHPLTGIGQKAKTPKADNLQGFQNFNYAGGQTGKTMR